MRWETYFLHVYDNRPWTVGVKLGMFWVPVREDGLRQSVQALHTLDAIGFWF